MARDWTEGTALIFLLKLVRHQATKTSTAPEPEPEFECGACGAPLDGDCDHCCRACLGGETCPACAPVEDC